MLIFSYLGIKDSMQETLYPYQPSIRVAEDGSTAVTSSADAEDSVMYLEFEDLVVGCSWKGCQPSASKN